MFYLEHQEKWNKLMKKREKIGGGENINLMRKNRKWGGGGWLEGRITTRDLKEDSDGGQTFATRISAW